MRPGRRTALLIFYWKFFLERQQATRDETKKYYILNDIIKEIYNADYKTEDEINARAAQITIPTDLSPLFAKLFEGSKRMYFNKRKLKIDEEISAAIYTAWREPLDWAAWVEFANLTPGMDVFQS